MKKKLSILFAMLAVMVTTAYADNVISASDFKISQSGLVDLAVNLTNTDAIKGIQFTLTLPEGISVQGSDAGITYDDGGTQTYTPTNGVKVSTTGRTSGWTVVGNETGDNTNTYKFVLISLSGAEIPKEGSGAVMKISFQAADNATTKEYEEGVKMTDIHLAVSGSNNDSEQVGGTTAKLTVINFVNGDVNVDGVVTPSDAIMILYDFFNAEQSGFNVNAADLNGDGDITPADSILALYSYFNAGSANARSVQVDDELEPQ